MNRLLSIFKVGEELSVNAARIHSFGPPAVVVVEDCRRRRRAPAKFWCA